MLAKGEYIVFGNRGVCIVEDITTVCMEGINKEKLYYLLKPVYLKSSTIYTAVDNKTASIRSILSVEEALALIDSLPSIGLLCVTDDKNVETVYKDSIHKNDVVELVKIIKTSYLRQEERIRQGRKIVITDEKYFKLACEYLFGELSVCLNRDRYKIEDELIDKICRKK